MQSRSQHWTPRVSLLSWLALLSLSERRVGRSRPDRHPDRKSSRSATAQPGNYLSALIASADRDTPAAEVYYREALRADPRNPDLLERAFAAALSNGDEASASSLGEKLLHARSEQQPRATRDRGSRYRAGTIRGCASPPWRAPTRMRARDVTTALLTAWSYAGQSDLRHALDTLDRIRDPSRLRFSRLSRGPDCGPAGKLRRGPTAAEVRV